ncbi:MAG: glycosyltransferase family 1 protein, partial [Nitrospinota bacterium]
GNQKPHKNLGAVISAFERAVKIWGFKYCLVIAGIKKGLFNGMNNKIIYVDIDNDGDLIRLYQSADLLLSPSLYEGFGLPALEAMACGCPVVASNVASLPEVCGDAAYYVAPDNIESIAEGIYKVLTDNELRQGLVKKGFERAKLFNWEKSAKEHLKVFEDVLNS